MTLSPPPMDAPATSDVRLPVLERLLSETGGGVALTFGLRRDAATSQLRLMQPAVVGPDPVAAVLRGLDGSLFRAMDTDVGHQAAFGRFTVRTRKDLPPPAVALWEKMGVTAALGAHAADGDDYLGFVYVQRLVEGRPFKPGARKAAQAMWPELMASMVAASRRVAAEAVPRCMVVSPDGDAVWWEGEGRHHPLARDIRRRAARFLEGSGRARYSVQGLLVTQCRLRGAEGAVARVRIEATEAMKVAPVMRLTPMKRRIAAAAARGATVAEIAEQFDRSPETVRTHLKRVYEALGVANRVELAECCRAVWA